MHILQLHCLEGILCCTALEACPVSLCHITTLAASWRIFWLVDFWVNWICYFWDKLPRQNVFFVSFDKMNLWANSIKACPNVRKSIYSRGALDSDVSIAFCVWQHCTFNFKIWTRIQMYIVHSSRFFGFWRSNCRLPFPALQLFQF